MGVSVDFDVDGFMKALTQRLIVAMNDLINSFYREAIMGMKAGGKADSEVEGAVLTDKFTDPEADYQAVGKVAEFIQARCVFYAQAILDSFGTGVYADTSADSYWEDYKKSDFWNKTDSRNIRTGIAIVGRPAGTYTDIFGNKDRYSSGRAVGRIVEGYTDPYGNLIESQPGSHSIQQAEAWIMRKGETRIERRIEMEVAKFLQEETAKYFREVTT